MENNILPESENQARKNLFVDDFYKLESSPQPQGGKYKLRILEFEQEHSYFSNFELVRAIHPKNLTSAVLDGKMVFYKEPKLPSKIINNQGKNTLKAISRGDAFKGSAEDFLSVKFENLTGKENALIWQASLRAGYPRVESIQKALKRLKTEKQIGNFLNKMSSMPWKVAGTCFVAAVGFCHSSCKVSIIFYLHSSSGKKGKKIGMTHPREMPSTGLMKISPKSKTLDIGLEWTNTHKLSALGLAQLASSEEVKKTKVESIALESLSHSQKKEITKKDLIKGGVELKPVQHIELDFPYKKITLKSGETVSYFLKSKGYYKKV